MPNIIAVPNPDGTVGSIVTNEWDSTPVVQEPGPQGGNFDLKAPVKVKAEAVAGDKPKPKTTRRKTSK